MGRDINRVFDALFALFAEGDDTVVASVLRGLDRQGWQDLIASAALHKCAPLLRHRLQQRNLLMLAPDTVQRRLQRIQQRNAALNLERLRQLRAFRDALDPDIPLIVLKGGRLVATHYPDLSLRTMVDLDLLVREEHLPDAVATLAQIGFAPREECTDNQYSEHHHVVPMYKDGTTIELHRALYSPPAPFTVDLQALWIRAQPAGQASLSYLALEDHLLHTCTHATYNHTLEGGFYALLDIAQISRDPLLRWDAVVQRAREWRAERCILLSLLLAERLAGARIPADVLVTLQAPDWNPAIAKQAEYSLRHSLEPGTARNLHVSNVMAGLLTAEAWHRLPGQIRRRLLVPREQRVRWSPDAGSGWFAQFQPLLAGLAGLLVSPSRWRQLTGRIQGKRLARWMRRAV